MSNVRDILVSVQDTEGAISRLEQLARDNPEDMALRFNLDSLAKRRGDLIEQLQEDSYADQVDLCEYKIVTDAAVSVPAIGRSLQAFQEVVTAVYDALTSAPKERFRPSAEALAESSLDFGFSYRGSLGFVLTIPNQRLIAIESEMDQAAAKTLELISSSTSEQISEIAKTVGIAAVSRAHVWAKVHSQYALTTDIKWWKGKEVFLETLRQPNQIEQLRTAIELTSDSDVKPLKLTGRMVGLDVETNFFHLKPKEGGDIRGGLSDELKASGSWEIPAPYEVDVVRSSKLKYSTGKENVSWTLTGLNRIK